MCTLFDFQMSSTYRAKLEAGANLSPIPAIGAANLPAKGHRCLGEVCRLTSGAIYNCYKTPPPSSCGLTL